MQLASQQATLIKILHDHSVYHLEQKDFKPASDLQWVKNTPFYVQQVWPEFLGHIARAVALEDSTTGYFFAAAAHGDAGGGKVVCAPGMGYPRPLIADSKDWEELVRYFAAWAQRLKTELDAKPVWGGKFPAGTLPLTLGKLAMLHQRMEECGLSSMEPSYDNARKMVRLAVPEKEYFFEFQPKWGWTFSPGQFTPQQTSSGTWNQLLDKLIDWTNYLHREDSVAFPERVSVTFRGRYSSMPPRRKWNLRSLRLQNIRKFHDLTVEFIPGVNVLCGMNGTGKSTILRCLAIGLSQAATAQYLVRLVPGGLIASDQTEASIEIAAADEAGAERTLCLKLARQGGVEAVVDHFANEEFEEPFICGYGSGFSLSGTQDVGTYSTAEATRSLFDYGAKLFGLEIVLRRLKDLAGDLDQYEEKLRELSKIIGLEGSVRVVEGGGLEVLERERRFPLDGLADGYRVSLTWLVDLLGWAIAARTLRDMRPEGLLLIDEVDKHTHPEVQSTLIQRIQESLPGMQMFLTTHNPLTVLGTDPSGVHFLKEESGKLTAHRSPDFRGYSVEDMYADPDLFDAERYSPEVVTLLAQHRKLAAIPREKRAPAETEQLVRLAQQLGELVHRD